MRTDPFDSADRPLAQQDARALRRIDDHFLLLIASPGPPARIDASPRRSLQPSAYSRRRACPSRQQAQHRIGQRVLKLRSGAHVAETLRVLMIRMVTGG